jgi:hypothetical protein
VAAGADQVIVGSFGAFPDGLELTLGEHGDHLGEHAAQRRGQVEALGRRCDGLAGGFGPIQQRSEVQDASGQAVQPPDGDNVERAAASGEPGAEFGPVPRVDRCRHASVIGPAGDTVTVHQ